MADSIYDMIGSVVRSNVATNPIIKAFSGGRGTPSEIDSLRAPTMKIAEVAANLAPGLGDILAGKQAIDSARQVLPAYREGGLGPASHRVADVILNGVGMLPAVPALGTIAGVGAKTADLVKLSEAESLMKQGLSNEKVWQQTGWWKGPEGKWRFEIPDDEMVFHGQPSFLNSGQSVPLGKAISHPKLEKAYPDLVSQLRVRTDGSLNPDQGAYLKSSKKIDLGIDYDPSIKNNFDRSRMAPSREADTSTKRSTMVHELSHAVQDVEGFAPGGSPSFMSKEAIDLLPRSEAELKKDLDFYSKLDTAKMLTERPYFFSPEKAVSQVFKAELPAFQDLAISKLPSLPREKIKETFSKLLHETSQGSGYRAYKRLAGEADARLAQTRLNYTPAERASKFPYADLDVPEDELIVMGDRGPYIGNQNMINK